MVQLYSLFFNTSLQNCTKTAAWFWTAYPSDEKIETISQFNRLLREIKKLINEERPVAALGYRTPVEFENWVKSVPVEQRPEVKLYDFIQRE